MKFTFKIFNNSAAQLVSQSIIQLLICPTRKIKL